MKRKTIIIIMIVIAAIVLTYWIMPDLIVGPFDDGVLTALAVCAEVVLGILQAVKKTLESESSSNYSSYQQYYQQSNQNGGSAHDSDDQEEFQFFAGCTDWEQVKSRYRDLMKIYHPDAGGHEEASKKINAEYEILKKRFGH